MSNIWYRFVKCATPQPNNGCFKFFQTSVKYYLVNHRANNLSHSSEDYPITFQSRILFISNFIRDCTNCCLHVVYAWTIFIFFPCMQFDDFENQETFRLKLKLAEANNRISYLEAQLMLLRQVLTSLLLLFNLWYCLCCCCYWARSLLIIITDIISLNVIWCLCHMQAVLNLVVLTCLNIFLYVI